jgi:hypothetical protein
MGLAAFQPLGGGTRISSTLGSATVAIQPSVAGLQFAKVTNQSTLDAWIAISASSAVAAKASTTVASSGNMLIMQRETFVVGTPPSCWVSAITTAGQADLIFQPGNAGTLG